MGAACRAWSSRVPLDEDQASLGEALMTVHTMQAAASTTPTLVKSSICMSPQAQKAWGSPGFPVFKHSIHDEVIAKDFALQIILFTLCIWGKQ